MSGFELLTGMNEKQKDQFRERCALLSKGKCPVNDRDRSTPLLDAIAKGRSTRNKFVIETVAQKIGYSFDEVRCMSDQRIEEILKYGY